MFDAREATISTVHGELFSGRVSCRDVVQAFLARIEAFNHLLNAIVCLNPNALEEADLLDQQLTRGEPTGVLFGIPILLKDNFDSVGMVTSAGSLALKDHWPKQDASAVAALRKAGAIILGKTNLHEFALEGLTVSSLGGQTLNPYDLTRTPGGSSGGSAAAVAASFAVMATGTDTVNSLRSPASANSLYAFKPTRGLISRAGIIPVSFTQDTIGMIGRSLSDLAVALTVMSSTEPESGDEATGEIPRCIRETEYTTSFSVQTSGELRDLRIGLICNFFDPRGATSETRPVTQVMHHVQDVLRAKGVTIVDIVDADTFDADKLRSTLDVQMYEIRGQLDTYLSSSSTYGNHPTSFKEIFQQGKTNYLVIPSQYQYIQTALESSTASTEYSARKIRGQELSRALHEIFEANKLDAIIYPQQRNMVVPVGSDSQHGRNGILAAASGFPVVAVPAGFSAPTGSAPIGIPVGLEILGAPGTEAKLLRIATQIDEHLRARKMPVTVGLDRAVRVLQRYDSVPVIVPRGLQSVDCQTYPPGQYEERFTGTFNLAQ